jgi:hypothetical protein
MGMSGHRHALAVLYPRVNAPPGTHWIEASGRGVTLTTHPHLVLRSRMSRSYTSSPSKCYLWRAAWLLCFVLLRHRGVSSLEVSGQIFTTVPVCLVLLTCRNSTIPSLRADQREGQNEFVPWSEGDMFRFGLFHLHHGTAVGHASTGRASEPEFESVPNSWNNTIIGNQEPVPKRRQET